MYGIVHVHSAHSSFNLPAILRPSDRWIAIVRAIAVNEVVTFASATTALRILFARNGGRIADAEFIGDKFEASRGELNSFLFKIAVEVCPNSPGVAMTKVRARATRKFPMRIAGYRGKTFPVVENFIGRQNKNSRPRFILRLDGDVYKRRM